MAQRAIRDALRYRETKVAVFAVSLLAVVLPVAITGCGETTSNMDNQDGHWGEITDPQTGVSFRCYADEYLSWCYRQEQP